MRRGLRCNRGGCWHGGHGCGWCGCEYGVPVAVDGGEGFVEWFAVEEDARTRGLDVLGVWHTHPDHPAHPSETDRAAAWEGWSYVIASVERGEVADVRSWRLDGDSFVEEEIAS